MWRPSPGWREGYWWGKSTRLPEVDDRNSWNVPLEQVDVFVTNTEISGKTFLSDLSRSPFAQGIYLFAASCATRWIFRYRHS